jgi:transcriptional regulator with XRE-family HTH domain
VERRWCAFERKVRSACQSTGGISLVGDNRCVERPTIIELARRAAGLTQAELAARAGTTQSAVSMYERRRKIPLLDIAERLMQAAGADLGMVTTVVFEVDFLPWLKAFWYPDRLWRVEVPGCFDRVRMPDLVGGTEQDEWDLRDRTDRRRLFENLLVEGTQYMMMRWVDGALLVDVWAELVLPEKVRAAWEPAVAAASAGRSIDVFASHG